MSESIIRPGNAVIVPDSPEPVDAALESNVDTTSSELESRLQSILQEPESDVASDIEPSAVPEPSQPENNETQKSKYSEEELTRFQEMFRDVMGIEADQFKAQYEQTQIRHQQEKLENDLQSLESSWGVSRPEVAQRLNLISEKLSTMSPELQASLNNLEGIQLIWSSILNDATRQIPPRFEKRTVAPTPRGQKPVFTRAEIAAMDATTYERNIKAIEAAYAQGLVQ